MTDSLRDALIDFALWMHPTWMAESEDDRDSATRAVDAYLADTNEEDDDE